MAKTSSNPLIPVTLVTGLLGSGKTTFIHHLLRHKPQTENWVLIINEFGEIGIDGALLNADAPESTQIHELHGGCICCSAQHNLAQTLKRLLSQPSPHRILIEPSGLGNPAQVLDTLRLFKAHFEIQNQFCLFDASRFTETLYQKSALLRDMLQLSDVVLINKLDLVEQVEPIIDFLAEHLYAKPQLIPYRPASFDFNIVFKRTPRPALILLSGDSHQVHTQPSLKYPSQLHEVVDCQIQTGLPSSIGWVFSPSVLFNRTALKKLLETPPAGLLRLKGLIRTGKQWQNVNWVNGQLDFADISWRQDSRIEMIFDLDLANQTDFIDNFEKNLALATLNRDLIHKP
jgi:G3E family GTPase